jgi:hypothetical protein
MYDDDQLNDTAVLRELRDSLPGAAMPERPPLAAITARGRAQRRRRLFGAQGGGGLGCGGPGGGAERTGGGDA